MVKFLAVKTVKNPLNLNVLQNCCLPNVRNETGERVFDSDPIWFEGLT